MENNLKNSEVAKLLVQKKINFRDNNLKSFLCNNIKSSDESITENSFKNKHLDSAPIPSFIHTYNKNTTDRPNKKNSNTNDIIKTLESNNPQNKTLVFSILPSQSQDTSTHSKWPPIDLSLKTSKNKNIGSFEMQNILNPTSVHLDKITFDNKDSLDNDNVTIKTEPFKNNDSHHVALRNNERSENHSLREHDQVTNQKRNKNSDIIDPPLGLSDTHRKTSKSNTEQSFSETSFCNFLQKPFATSLISSQINSHSSYTQAPNSLNKARYSIINTNPSITSLLLDKHASNTSSVDSLRFIPVVASSAFETTRPVSTLETNKNFRESFYKSGSPRSMLTIIPTLEKVPLIASESPSNKKPSEVLKNLLLKPSTSEEPKSLCSVSVTNVFLNKNSTDNKVDTNLPNENKLLTDIKSSGVKIKNEVMTCEDDDEKKSNMSNGCDGCECDCDFCPKDGLKPKQMPNGQNDKSEPIFITKNGFIDLSNGFAEKIEKKNTIESLLLLKNGYKSKTNSQNKCDSNNDDFLTKFENNLSSHHKKENSFEPNGFLFSADNITKFKQTLFDKKKKQASRCCSNETNTNEKTLENSFNKNSFNKQAFCLPKRKFIEMKNKDAYVQSEMNQQTNDNFIDSCGMPCCKKTRQGSGNMTSKFNLCKSSCSPLTCTCLQPEPNNSSIFSNKSIEEKSCDMSLSETSTISITPLKSASDEEPNALMDASTQWCFEDSDKSIFYKDFSTQCSLDDQLKPERCKLCNCCIQSESPIQPSFPISLNNINENLLDLGVLKNKKALNDIQMKCHHCGLTFDDEVIFSIHMGSHSHHSPFTCNLCGKKCLNKYGFNTHVLHGHHYVSA